ncbi:hypothetical protein [Acinetobacter johnsonii]|uniref:hypothetical protein n=1 Tax=Acinetobacter johnsonii TaxID=40214 RepID=UPI001F33F604|nr:hypothetical protein [Acinetobacter johnsonii]
MKKIFLQLSLILLSSFSYAFDGLELNEEEFHPLAKKYVNIETLNVRNKPENGEIIEKLARGDAVLIYDRKDDWERLSKEFESPKWVLSKYLCTFENCFLKGDLYSKSAVKNNYSRHIKSQPTTKIKKTYSSSCSCGSGSYCYGPRGGRYCYTSGGNKSYR